MNLDATSRCTQRVRGFTLMEVVLAVGIFAIVLVSINTAFFASLRLRQRTEENLEESLPLTQGLALLRRDLQNAVQPGGVLLGNFRGGAATLTTTTGTGTASTSTGSSSTGSSTSGSRVSGSRIIGSKGAPSVLGVPQAPGLDFVTSTGTLSDQAPWGDIQQVNYQLVVPEDTSKPGMDLVRSVTRNLLATASEVVPPQRLAGNIESLEFLFFDGTQWRDQWDTTSTDTVLPLAVRMRLFLVAPETSTVRQEPIEMIVLLPSIASTNSASATTTTGGAR
jgi:prepilin-type N-terminal cleavage/methylation domain-containing protein